MDCTLDIQRHPVSVDEVAVTIDVAPPHPPKRRKERSPPPQSPSPHHQRTPFRHSLSPQTVRVSPSGTVPGFSSIRSGQNLPTQRMESAATLSSNGWTAEETGGVRTFYLFPTHRLILRCDPGTCSELVVRPQSNSRNETAAAQCFQCKLTPNTLFLFPSDR